MLSEVRRVLERQRGVGVVNGSRGVSCQLIKQGGHDIDCDSQPRGLLYEDSHVVVVLGCVEPGPGQIHIAGLPVAVIRLVHVPEDCYTKRLLCHGATGPQPETIADLTLRRKKSRRPASGANRATSEARWPLIAEQPRNPRLARISLDSENTWC